MRKIFHLTALIQFTSGMCFGGGVMALADSIEQADSLLLPFVLIVIGLLNGVTWFAYHRHQVQLLNTSAA